MVVSAIYSKCSIIPIKVVVPQDKCTNLRIVLCSGINESIPCFRNSILTETGKILLKYPESLDWSEISLFCALTLLQAEIFKE